MTEPITTVCPYCRAGLEPEDIVTPCPACGTPHHADCFTENGGCTIFGCTAAPADEAPISITPTDLHPPQQNPSLYNFNTPQASPASHTAPPPPLPPGSAPPPPLLATPFYQPHAYSSYVKPKSRVAFVLLAVFLGSFGAHNFYAGYTRKAIAQLLITLCTCFYASLITWIWAIVEACTINTDDDGVPLN